MKNPFPGMNPYLEGYLWPDVHSRMTSIIAEIVGRQIAPNYVARIELYTINDNAPQEDIGIMYPDAGTFKNEDFLKEPSSAAYGKNKAISPPTIDIPIIKPIKVRIPVVEIRDSAKNKLITAIEILSPVNKRKPGLSPYREKREKLHGFGVHLLELDLLRRGTRTFTHPDLPKTHYLISLWRAHTDNLRIWGFDVQDSPPIVPVPLKAPDDDAILDLKIVMDLVFERGLYYLSLDYTTAPPKPPFSEIQLKWMEKLIKK